MIPCATTACKSQATWKVYINDLDYVHTCSNHVADHHVPGFDAVEIFPMAVRTNVYKSGKNKVNKI